MSMAIEVFNWSPRPNPVGTFKDRTLRVQFGDGYEQEAADGIHAATQSWPLEFVGREAHIRPILEFVKRHAGYRAFFWTPPMGEQGYYKAREVRLRAMGGDMFTLTFTMDQAFKP